MDGQRGRLVVLPAGIRLIDPDYKLQATMSDVSISGHRRWNEDANESQYTLPLSNAAPLNDVIT